MGDFFSMLFSLVGAVCIIVLTYYASRWYARKMGPIAGGKHIRIIDRVVVSRTGSVLIVDIGGRQYLLGVSDQNVQILMELDETIPLPVDRSAGGDGLKGLIGGDGYKSLFKSIKKRGSED
jgi:flagellar protein FliO/FliZ